MTTLTDRPHTISAAESVPFIPWNRLLRRMDWQQGEHVSLVGPTGCGKSTAMLGLLPLRKYVVVIGTKAEDDTLDELIESDGYKRIFRWPPPRTRNRIIVWPEIRYARDAVNVGPVLAEALDEIYAQRGWCIAVDEVWFACKILGLTRMMEIYWTQARSARISVVSSTQRPAHVPLFFYSQATHLFIWAHNDRRDLDRLRDISSTALTSTDVRAIVPALAEHEALYLNTRTGLLCRTKAPER